MKLNNVIQLNNTEIFKWAINVNFIQSNVNLKKIDRVKVHGPLLASECIKLIDRWGYVASTIHLLYLETIIYWKPLTSAVYIKFT